MSVKEKKRPDPDAPLVGFGLCVGLGLGLPGGFLLCLLWIRYWVAG